MPPTGRRKDDSRSWPPPGREAPDDVTSVTGQPNTGTGPRRNRANGRDWRSSSPFPRRSRAFPSPSRATFATGIPSVGQRHSRTRTPSSPFLGRPDSRPIPRPTPIPRPIPIRSRGEDPAPRGFAAPFTVRPGALELQAHVATVENAQPVDGQRGTQDVRRCATLGPTRPATSPRALRARPSTTQALAASFVVGGDASSALSPPPPFWLARWAESKAQCGPAWLRMVASRFEVSSGGRL
jgi:hypothetical protein